MITLHSLKDESRGRQARMRVGRGMGSGKGKTSGRGQKGQGARSGYKRRYGKEGGQFPLYLKLPTRGFSRVRFRKELHTINVGQIEDMIMAGALKETDTINLELLRSVGYISGKSHGLKVLGDGELTKAVHIEAQAVSSGAREKLQKAAATVTIVDKKGASAQA
ncbi:50S ribosomal protein L15 [Chlamydiales bacterium SCGC AG-110-P3]|nr:50S ribosomal protein L15 [Chlamydiales bacterium SCGC AG-110-P3]